MLHFHCPFLDKLDTVEQMEEREGEWLICALAVYIWPVSVVVALSESI